MKQYFETVEVSSAGLPPIDKADPQWEELEWSEEVFVIDNNGNKNSAFYAYREKVWYSNGKMTDAPTHYLRPVSLSDLLGTNSAYPLPDALKYLIRATEILLHKKDYDGPDYEEMEHSIKSATAFINSLTNTASNEHTKTD